MEYKYVPPKLPFAWIASTLVVPLLTLILPNIFTDDKISLETRAIVALALLAVFLFVSCIALILRLYDSAFGLQMVARDIDLVQEKRQIIVDKAVSDFEAQKKILKMDFAALEERQAQIRKELDELRSSTPHSPESTSQAQQSETTKTPKP